LRRKSYNCIFCKVWETKTLPFFYKINFIRTRSWFLLKVYKQIKNNTSLGRRTNSNFQFKNIRLYLM